MPGPYEQVGAKLVERGYSAIPIMPGTKMPGFGKRGIFEWRERFSNRLPTEIEISHWSTNGAGVGVVAGPASHDLVGIDIDTDDRDISAAILAVLPPTPVRKTGQKGETLFFRSTAIAGSPSFNIGGRRVLDIIGPGRQTVLPPTYHPDTGQPYRWTGEAALEAVDPDDLPVLPDDILDQIAAVLKPLGYQAEPVRQLSRGEMGEAGTPHRSLNDSGMDNLAAWVPKLELWGLRPARGGYEAVPEWRGSTTGRPLEKRKRNLKVHPTGIRDMGTDQTFTPLDLVMAACACDLGTAFQKLSGWLGLIPETIELKPRAQAAPASPKAPDRPPESAPSGVTDPPGLLGDITDWICATARRPNRLLALGAAITVLGTLVGRRLSGPTRSGTHLYVLGLAPTGAGKDHPLAQITRLMKAAKAQHHLGPDEFMSMSAVINTMQSKPLCLCPMDEFGAFLKRINSRRASGHEQGITKILRSAWSKSFSTMQMPEWANRTIRPIESPALSIYGVSTPDEFYGSLEGGDVVNGVLNRFLILKADGKITDRDPQSDPADVPEYLVDALQQVYSGDNPLITARLNDPGLEAAPHPVSWAGPDAEGVYVAMLGEIERAVERTPSLAAFMARTGEMSIRLATIRAVGHGPQARSISADDIAWGRDLAMLSAQAMAGDAMDFMATNERQTQANKIIRLSRRPGGVSIREIQQYMRGSMRSADIKEIVFGLKDGGIIEEVDVTDPKKHTCKVIVYKVVS